VSEAAPRARIELVTRQGCHLCDAARPVVAAVAAEQGVGWVERDVDADPALRAAHGDEVPVVLVDGRRHSCFTVDPAALAKALRPGRSGALRWLRR
jgi:glutaredoxin